MDIDSMIRHTGEALLNHTEAKHGADLNSDGMISSQATNEMFDEQYGGMLVGYGKDWSNFYERRVTPQMRTLEKRVGTTLRDLDSQIADAGSQAEKRELQALKQEVESTWQNLHENPPVAVKRHGVSTESLVNFQHNWLDRLDQMDESLIKAQSSTGSHATTDARLPAFEPLPQSVFDAVDDVMNQVTNPSFLSRMSDMVDRLGVALSGGAAASNARGASDAEGAATDSPIDAPGGAAAEASSSSSRSSGSFIGNTEFGGKSVDEMMQMASDHPEALADHMDGLGTEEKQKAMQAMMQRMQEINQMFTMLSNIMKAMHDTAKAAINNMRV